VRQQLGGRGIDVALFLLILIGCGDGELEPAEETPTLAPLERLGTISKPTGFSVSSAASTDRCEVLLLGSRGGSYGVVPGEGRDGFVVRGLPTFNRPPSLEHLQDDRFIVWAAEPPFVAILDLGSGELSLLPVGEHPWGGLQVGPLMSFGGGVFAMAPIGAVPPRREPVPWVGAPLVDVFDRNGRKMSGLGVLEDQNGLFMTWRLARVGLGHVGGDTLVAVNLARAVLMGYRYEEGREVEEPLWEVQLPRYFEAPEPREEVWIPEWIQVGGEMQLFLDVPHVAAVAFGEGGRVYAIRNHLATWRRSSNAFTSTQGRWAITRRALEIYSPQGAFLGAFALPGSDPAWLDSGWLRVDQHGRIFFPDGAGGVIVVKDPFVRENECGPLSDTIRFREKDVPSD